MAIGPGKYDDVLTVARETITKVAPDILGTVLIVLAPADSPHSSFCVQATLAGQFALPAILRMMADDIETGLRTGAAFAERGGGAT